MTFEERRIVDSNLRVARALGRLEGAIVMVVIFLATLAVLAWF